ncbi:MAG TPA: thiol-disulfide isomerase [Bryobacteraceae bacterium]
MTKSVFLSLALAAALFGAEGPVTFNKNVLSILQKNCQTCHRPGEIAPMSFLTYESTRPWAKSIRTAVLTKKMPPWFADPRYGHFLNDRRLSEADVATLVAWADQGAPEGDANDKPAPVEWHEGWNIKPDVVFSMSKPFKVPAKGTVEYTYFVVPTNFKQDTWLLDGEIRPGNRKVVHHASVHVRPPGSLWMKDAKLGEPYVPPKQDGKEVLPAPVDPRFTVNEWLVGYVPGVHAEYFDLNHQAAKLIPAGSDLVFEMHYTANGTEQEDMTRVGFVLAKEPPKERLVTLPLARMDFTIPPGDANYGATTMGRFDEPVKLIYSQPHMHLRGKDMDIELHYPTGESEMLVSVPHFDFNWQMIYYEQKPREIPKGTRIELIAHWDNSANNKNNPDPTVKVTWGDQSWDEMLFAWVGVVVPKTVDTNKVLAMGVK